MRAQATQSSTRIVIFMLVAGLHALFSAPLYWGSSTRHRPLLAEQLGVGSTQVVAAADFPTTLVLLDAADEIESAESPFEVLASRGIKKLNSEIEFLSSLPGPYVEIDQADVPALVDRSDPSSAEDESEGRVRLFGKYMNQIVARIERTWIRPRTPIGAVKFTCHAHVEQDVDGRVLSVELARCNGDGRWQQSLARAIQRASPLTGPSQADLFTNKLDLVFESYPYAADFSFEDQFESAQAAQQAMAVMPGKERVVDASGILSKDKNFSGNVRLEISGNSVQWIVSSTEAIESRTAEAAPSLNTPGELAPSRQ